MRDRSKVREAQKGGRSQGERLAGHWSIRWSVREVATQVVASPSAWAEVGRRAGQGGLVKTLEGWNPREDRVRKQAKPLQPDNGLSRGWKPRGRSSQCTAGLASRFAASMTACGVNPAERSGYLAGEETSEGWIPWALPARSMAGTDWEGGNRREGNQTLRTEGGGQGRPAWTGPPSLDVL